MQQDGIDQICVYSFSNDALTNYQVNFKEKSHGLWIDTEQTFCMSVKSILSGSIISLCVCRNEWI